MTFNNFIVKMCFLRSGCQTLVWVRIASTSKLQGNHFVFMDYFHQLSLNGEEIASISCDSINNLCSKFSHIITQCCQYLGITTLWPGCQLLHKKLMSKANQHDKKLVFKTARVNSVERQKHRLPQASKSQSKFSLFCFGREQEIHIWVSFCRAGKMAV